MFSSHTRKIIAILMLIPLFSLFIIAPVQAYHAPPWDKGHDGTRGQPDDGTDPENPCKPPCKNDPCSQGSPVYLIDGNFLYSTQDLFIPGRIPYQITRSYNSKDNFRSGLFGYGWVFAYEYRVLETEDTDTKAITAIILMPTGQRYDFKKEGNAYTPPPNVYDTLTKTNNIFTLQKKDGTTYTFDADGKLSSISDRNGNTLTFTYDSGVISVITDNVGRKLDFLYGANGKVSSITDSAGRSFRYDYDANGDLTKYTNAESGETVYTYDTDHNLKTISDPRKNQILSINYTTDGKVDNYTDENGETWTYTYISPTETHKKSNSNGNTWKFIFNDKGLITQETDPLGNAFSRMYCDEGCVKSVTDKNGKTTSFEYDDKGNITKISAPLNSVTIYTYHPEFNKPTSITDPLQNKTVFEYDAKGNLEKITDALNHVTLLKYKSNGDISSITDARNNTTTFEYDSYGYPQLITDALGNKTVLQYDALGNLKQVADAESNSTKYDYDKLNRITEVVNALGYKTNYAYDESSNLKEITDANTNKTAYTYTIHNQIETVTDAMGYITKYVYYPSGNLKTITDAKQNTTSYEYDALNRLKKTTYPDGTTEIYDNDKIGNIEFKTTRNGDKITYGYDDLNRLKTKTYPDSTQVNYTYDLLNLKTASNAKNTITYDYDKLNRIKQVTQDTKVIQYEYDSVGNRTKLIYPDATYIIYSHDVLNRLDQIKDSAGQVIADYDYDKLGRRSQLSLKNGSQVVYQYDSLSRLKNLTNKTNQTIISSFAYEYDNVGNRKSMTTPKGIHSYSYDKIYQLTKADYPNNYPFADMTYNYDKVGNRISTVNGESVNYTANKLNQYDKVGDVQYGYDKNGNLTNDGINTYSYDYENRLIQVKTPNATVSFEYDMFGRRTKKINFANTSGYVHDGDQIIAEYDGNSNLIKKFVYGIGIDEPIALDDGKNQYFYHIDGLGSVTEMTDSAGAIKEKYSYEAYGKPVIKNTADSVLDKSGVGNAYLFTGREYDAETGLYYYRARYYDPGLGRFLSEDPIGLNGGDFNLYRYVGNNPVILTDPSGNVIPLLAIAGAIWFSAEVALSIYDAYDTATTILDPCASMWRKVIAGGLFLAGVFLPGGGYSKIDDVGKTINPNKLNHIFGQSKHNLGDLVNQFNSQENAYKALQSATEAVIKSQGIKGVFETTVKVGSETLTVRGNVIEGIVKIGTAFKP